MNLLKFDSYPIKYTLPFLLRDKTTKKNICWATKAYENLGLFEQNEIKVSDVIQFSGAIIMPRVEKTAAEQAQRTRKKAEVFTPSWIVNKMNNHCDEEWFSRKDVFNREDGQSWVTYDGKIDFPEGKTWKDYVDSRRIEITCGEAPYVVSRYDATTGELIEIKNRIGLLDRKLRVINENVETEQEWLEWVFEAYKSVYGYEYQGDNLLIARINLINTFVDYLDDRWHRPPTRTELRTLANIVVWNFWQMDGLHNTVPFASVENEAVQAVSIFDGENAENSEETPVAEANAPVPQICRIYDWHCNYSVPFTTRVREEK